MEEKLYYSNYACLTFYRRYLSAADDGIFARGLAVEKGFDVFNFVVNGTFIS